MASTTELDPSAEAQSFTSEQNRQRPLNSLVAAGKRITSKTLERQGTKSKSSGGWQEDAWDMYDLVGEQRFLATTLAGRMGQARFFVGRLADTPDEDITPMDSGPAFDAFAAIEGRGHVLSQIVTRAGLNLFVAGDGYVVGLPKSGPTGEQEEQPRRGARDGIDPTAGTPTATINAATSMEGIDLASLDWSFKSVSEVGFTREDVSIETDDGKKTYDPDTIVAIRVWRPHPRRWWDADSPTRSSLPVLRELVGLTMHVSAQVDSRLAGAGMLLIPESADRAVRAAAGLSEDGEDLSPFIEALMEAMSTAIADRSNASAFVPIMPVVPDESIDKFRFISFASSLDAEARNLRDEAIRRLALGQDCPPELLLGVGGMNHWGAWLVREDVVTTHIEPPLALFCDAMTTQFLWPVLEQQGVEDHEQYVIWYDVSHMIMRPDRSKDAKDLHERGAISDAALRDATGFEETDAPASEPTDPVVSLVMDLVRGAPSLIANPGLAVLYEQVRAMLEQQPIPDLPGQEEPGEPASDEEPAPAEEPDDSGDSADGPPDTADDPPAIAASGAEETGRVLGHIVNQIATGQMGPIPPGPPPVAQPRMIPLTHGGNQ